MRFDNYYFVKENIEFWGGLVQAIEEGIQIKGVDNYFYQKAVKLLNKDLNLLEEGSDLELYKKAGNKWFICFCHCEKRRGRSFK